MLSKRQRPKVDEYPDYLFAVFHFPVYDKAVQRLNAAELDIFLGPDYLVTLPNVELLPVTRLFHRCEEDERLRDELFAKGSGRLLYEVLDDLFDYCFPILDKIGHKLDSVEDDMFERRAEDVVRDLSNVKQEIISYRKIIKPERTTLRLLERRVERFLPEELDLYFDDIVDSAERIWDLLDNYKEVVEGLESTNESVISHRQNDVLRVLTVFSAILLPLTLLASVFGMNVDFPGSGTAGAFWVMAAVMVGVAAGCSASSAGSAGSSRRLQRSRVDGNFSQARADQRRRAATGRSAGSVKDHVESRASCVRSRRMTSRRRRSADRSGHHPLGETTCVGVPLDVASVAARARDAERAVDSIPAATVQSVTSRFRRVACGAVRRS